MAIIWFLVAVFRIRFWMCLQISAKSYILCNNNNVFLRFIFYIFHSILIFLWKRKKKKIVSYVVNGWCMCVCDCVFYFLQTIVLMFFHWALKKKQLTTTLCMSYTLVFVNIFFVILCVFVANFSSSSSSSWFPQPHKPIARKRERGTGKMWVALPQKRNERTFPRLHIFILFLVFVEKKRKKKRKRKIEIIKQLWK